MMQSMLFIKSEGKPGQAWQDETHIPTRDRSLTAVWIALDNATVENGCLWVIPGSHRAGVLYPDRAQHDPRFDCTREAYGFRYRERDAIPVELSAGAALVFDGYLLHRSLPNTGRHGLRRALVNHYMSARNPSCPGSLPVTVSRWEPSTIATSCSSPVRTPTPSRALPISCTRTSDQTEKAAASG
jgi:phytanoyl-CoA hydroxylase